MLAPGSSETTTEGYMENYKNVSQYIRDQLNAEAEDVQIILTGIDNDIYSIIDACQNACEMCKAIERLKQVYHPQNHPNHYTQNSSTGSQQAATRNRGKVIVNSPTPTYDQKPTMVAEDDEMSKDKEIDKLMALISFRANQDNTPKINRGTRYDSQRVVNGVGARENLEQANWRDDTDDKPEDQELEAHYLYMAQIQEVTPDADDNYGHIFDAEPLQKLIEIILFIVDSGCSKHMTRNLKLLSTITIKRVYYIEGLNHNLFSVGQFCDANLEVAFRKSTCYIHDLKGNDLLTGLVMASSSFSLELRFHQLVVKE
ncbi:hypothetical protein Tco_1125064 [Tanacetum coccineum]|uniref:Integrase, catalytic region, zinc finger, CCHC-type, peptidase aspartic, catalytic n=1 Tax=Tanacetum coccineum TaxID=301880 RepID=A0ABQ5J7Z9_9ASTR